METKTRLWLSLGAAVLVGGTGAGEAALPAAGPAASLHPPASSPSAAFPTAPVQLAQAEPGSFEGGEGGEGEGGEGGGQVLGTITEFRLASTDPNAFQYEAATQVATYGALVFGRYTGAHAGAVKMQDAIAALLADPSAGALANARTAWAAARAAYAQTEAYLFYAGPIDGEGGPIARINAWPVNAAFLDYVAGDPKAGLVNDPSIPITRQAIVRLDQASNPENVTTGWHAIEFMLWGEDRSATDPGARPFTDFVSGQGNNDRRRAYLQIVAQLLVNDFATVVAAWAPDVDNNYRGSIVAMDQRNAIGRAFNGMAVLAGYELALKRIGASLRRGGEEYEPSRFSDTTAADHVNGLMGIRDIYFGRAAGAAAGSGFDALVGRIDPALNQRVVAAFDKAERAVTALDTPYDSILASPRGSTTRTEGEAAVAALKDLADALRAAGNRLGVLVLIPGV